MNDARPPGPTPWDLELGTDWRPPALAPDFPHPLRMWDYMIGGKDNYQADRDAVEYITTLVPDLKLVCRAGEAFLQRAISWIAEPAQGLDQFLQLGTFIPTRDGYDARVRRHRADAVFVYVTDDPISAAHGRGVLAAQARPRGAVHVLLGEFREPAPILRSTWLNERLDLSRPLGVLLVGMLDHTEQDARLAAALEQIRGALPAGSLIVMLHFLDYLDRKAGARAKAVLGDNPFQYTTRSMERVKELVADFEFVEPGFVPCTAWRPDGDGPGRDLEDRCHIAGGVAVIR